KLGRDATVIGADFTIPMVKRAEIKATSVRRSARVAEYESVNDNNTSSVRGDVSFLAGDSMLLPFADGTFDLATVAFGIRNVADLRDGLREMMRVVRPGGRVVILEFTPQKN